MDHESDDWADEGHPLADHARPLGPQRWAQHGIRGSKKGRLEANIYSLLNSSWEKRAFTISISLGSLLFLISGLMVLIRVNSIADPPFFHNIPELLNNVSWTASLMGSLAIDPLADRALYSRNLGKNILILDVDTRPWTVEEPGHMAGTTWGRLNHYFYALMHGYDYRFIHAPQMPPDIHPTWAKLSAIHRTLKEGHRFIVFTDSDVIFPKMKLPLESLFEYWDITSDIALAMALTPSAPEHQDNVTHHQNLNSGFMIVQNIPIAHSMLQDWIECPSDQKFPGCSRWKEEFWHEQGAFGNYIRYEYPDRTREIPCTEGNGSPYHEIECKGTIISHYWQQTDKLAQGVQQAVAELVLPTVIEDMMAQWAEPL